MKKANPGKKEAMRKDAPPPFNQHVIAITPTFRCLGFLAADGKWYQVYNDKLLAKVIAWEPVG